MRYLYLILLTTIVYSQNSCSHNKSQILNSQEVKKLLTQNPKFEKQLIKFKNSISSNQRVHVLNKLYNNEWTEIQAYYAIDLYKQYNDNVRNTTIANKEGSVNSSIDKIINKFENDITLMFGKKTSDNNLSDIEKVFLETKIPWKLAQENQDSIDYYIKKGNVMDFRNYMNRLNNRTH